MARMPACADSTPITSISFRSMRMMRKPRLEETMSALNDLVRAGDVRYVGCSNYDAWRLTQALWVSDRHGWAPFVSVQPEYNLLSRDIERDLIPAAQEFGIGVIPYSPLASGVLTGKYLPGQPAPENTRGHDYPHFSSRLRAETLETAQRLDAWARERGHTASELALAWLAAQPSRQHDHRRSAHTPSR